MREIKLQVFSYDELSEDAQRKAREIDLLDNDWADWIVSEYKDKLKTLGILDASIGWDLYRNEVETDSDNVDIYEITKHAPVAIRPKLLKLFLDSSSITIKDSNVTCHTNEYVGSTAYPRLYDYLEDTAGLLEDSINNLLAKVEKQFLYSLEAEYEALTSDEYKEEYFRDNNTQFWSDGRVYELYGD